MCLVRKPGTGTTGKFTELKPLWVRGRRNRKNKGKEVTEDAGWEEMGEKTAAEREGVREQLGLQTFCKRKGFHRGIR